MTDSKSLSLEERRRRLDAALRAGVITEAQHKSSLEKAQRETAAVREDRASPASERSGGRPRTPRPSSRPRVDHSELASAPYRFVTFPGKNVLAAEEAALKPIHLPKADGYCAHIDVLWIAETPLLVGEESGTTVVPASLPTANGATEWFIPGSTLRGAIRATAEIVGFGRLTEFNRERTFGLRDFEHESYGATRYPIGDVEKLQAGWLRKSAEPGGYEILPCAQWYVIAVEELLRAGELETDARSARDFTRLPLLKKYAAARMVHRQGGAELVDFRARPKRFVRSEPINGKDSLRSAPNGDVEGYLVFSGPSPSGKRLEYVFPAPDERKAWPVKSDAWEQFTRINSIAVKDRLDPSGSWKEFSEILSAFSDAYVPIFFVGDVALQRTDSFAMGLTRLFKVPHDRGLKEVLEDSGADAPPLSREKQTGKLMVDTKDVDMVANLFGYVYEAEHFGIDESQQSGDPGAFARKGRIAFSSARLVEPDAAELTPPLETVMMGARPSFSPFYLRGRFKDYSDPSAKIAGRKRYLPRYPLERLGGARKDIESRLAAQIDAIKAASGRDRVSEEVKTRLRFLVPKAGRELRFRSRIRFFNVTAAELGLVLWTLTHGGAKHNPDGRLRHLIGRAKPFGAGQMRIADVRLAFERNDNRALEGEQEAGSASFLVAFEKHVTTTIDGSTWSAVIKEYLKSCDPEVGARLQGKGKLDYLPLRMERNDRRINPYQELRGMTKPRKDGSPPTGADRLLEFD